MIQWTMLGEKNPLHSCHFLIIPVKCTPCSIACLMCNSWVIWRLEHIIVLHYICSRANMDIMKAYSTVSLLTQVIELWMCVCECAYFNSTFIKWPRKAKVCMLFLFIDLKKNNYIKRTRTGFIKETKFTEFKYHLSKNF